MKTKKLSCFVVFLLAVLSGLAQQHDIDSLQHILALQMEDSAKFNTYIRLGDAYANTSTDSAIIYYNTALQLARNKGNAKEEIVASSTIANHLRLKHEDATALDLYLQNIRLSKQTGDTARLFMDIRDVSLIYSWLGDYEKEYEYVKQLKELLNTSLYKDSTTFKIYTKIVFIRFARVYLNLDKIDSAEYCYRILYNDAQTHDEIEWIALSAAGIGSIFEKRGMPDSSTLYYRIALAAAPKANRDDLLAGSLYNLGKLFRAKGQMDSAILYARLSFDTSYNIQSLLLSTHMDAASLLADIYSEKQQPDSAYKYLRLYVHMKDSLFGTEKLARLQTIGVKQSMTDVKIEQLKKEALLAYQYNVRIGGLIAGLVVLLILTLILFRNSRQREVAKREIENAYDQLKSTQAQLIQSEKMASLGQLTAGIAHEIQNPLNFVNNFSEVNKELLTEIKEEIEKGDYEEVKVIVDDVISNEQKINHHGKRADAIVKGMLQHSRTNTGKKELTDINALIDESLRLSYHGLRAKDKDFNATINTSFDESIGKLNIVPQDISRVVLNLFNNAFYAVNEKKRQLNGTFEPAISVCTKKLNGKIEIHVKDNGNGIPQNIVDKIFQPFFTTKPTGQGTGLGLSLSYDIIKAHRGEIKVESEEKEYAEFIIILPAQ